MRSPYQKGGVWTHDVKASLWFVVITPTMQQLSRNFLQVHVLVIPFDQTQISPPSRLCYLETLAFIRSVKIPNSPPQQLDVRFVVERSSPQGQRAHQWSM
jgi:hypothetical protein